MASTDASVIDGWRHAARSFAERLSAAVPQLLFGIRLWAAVCFALLVAFSLELDTPSWAGTSAAIVCQPVLGASLRKGWFRLVGTIIGAIAAVVLSACFPQSRAGFLLGLALWGGICAFVATLLRNFASYAAALAGFTAAIIVGDELGAVGGANGDAFNLAVARGSEIGIGIVCAGLVLAITDFGTARRRLNALLGDLSADVAGGLVRALRLTGVAQEASRTVRRRLVVRVSGLGTAIDQASGEITTLPFHARSLQRAADGLFTALTAWRSVANHLEFAPGGDAEAKRVRDCLPVAWADSEPIGDPARWRSEPWAVRSAMRQAARRLVALPADNPSLRLLCDRTAQALLGLSHAMTGVLVLGDPWVARAPSRMARPRVPDTLPALINAIRAFLTIGGASLIWIWTAWPNGATFIMFATVTITLFAPQEDAAYGMVRNFSIGTAFAAAFAAIVAFAFLPQQQSFMAFCAIIGVVLVPAGALAAQPWRQPLFVALQANFIPLLAPTNPMTYDPGAFYNSSVALLSGIGFAMLAMRLIPPMPPARRAERLLALTLRDLRRLTHGPLPRSSAGWEGKIYGRLSALADSVDLVQAARLATALAVGGEIIHLRRIAGRFGLGADLEPAMAAIAAGDSEAAIRLLDPFDRALEAFPPAQPGATLRLRARARLRSIAESLALHGRYFDGDCRA